MVRPHRTLTVPAAARVVETTQAAAADLAQGHGRRPGRNSDELNVLQRIQN